MISNGATGSRLLSGNSDYVEFLEVRLAEIFKAEAALLFNSGYVANLAVISAIAGRGDTILYDEKIHACIKEGARLSHARFYAFKHNDVEDLTEKVIRAEGHVVVVVESVYSMDGDQSPLAAIIGICEKHNAYLVVDEAHPTGTYGPAGAGLMVEKGWADKAFIRIHTFGKAMGVHGACVVASATIKDFLINFARPFIYTTALPLHSLVSIDSAFAYLEGHPQLQQQVAAKVDLFIESFQSLDLPAQGISRTESSSSIQALIFPGNEKVKKVADTLHQLGFDIRPILSPTVKAGEERLRICIHTYNTSEEIGRLLALLKKWAA